MLYQLSYFRGAAQSSPLPPGRRRADRGAFISTLGAVSARTFAVFIGVIAVIGLLAYGVISKGHGSLQDGDAAPVAELPALGGAAGQTGSIADYKGKWVLINVWASWCDPCRDEAPDLERFSREHQGDNFEILGVDTKDDQGSAQKFVEEFGLTYPQLHDGSGDYADDDLLTTGVPENFLVDPDGNVAIAIHGQVTPELLSEQIAPRLEPS